MSKHKKCLTCRNDYEFEDKKCPKCGSISFQVGYSTPSFMRKETPRTFPEVLGDIALSGLEIGLALASTTTEAVGGAFSSLSDIDFGGGGADSFFD